MTLGQDTGGLHAVEFVGLACSGKSVISERVIRELLRLKIPVVGSGEVSSGRLAFTLACAPRYLLAWWRVAQRYVRQGAPRAQLFRRACVAAAEPVYWSARNRVPVLDEGLFQMLRSLRRASTGELTYLR